MYHILVVDDEARIRSIIKKYAEFEGHSVTEAGDGMEAIRLCRKDSFDLIIMDIMMPELDGISAMVKLRETSNVPIILLTAKSEDADKILGLNVGADDYVTKPFSPAEVTARVASQLRRYTQLGAAKEKEKDHEYIIGGIELDDSAKRVTLDGEPVSLTPTEYEILKLLMSFPGKVFSPKDIYREIWKEAPASTTENTIAVHLRHIREKIEINPAEPRYLKAVWGHGYVIEDK